MTEKAGIRIENPTIQKEEKTPAVYVVLFVIAGLLIVVASYLVASELLHLPLPSFIKGGIEALVSSLKG